MIHRKYHTQIIPTCCCKTIHHIPTRGPNYKCPGTASPKRGLLAIAGTLIELLLSMHVQEYAAVLGADGMEAVGRMSQHEVCSMLPSRQCGGGNGS